MLEIRLYQISDTEEMIQLFRHSVHKVGKGVYSPLQLSTWAPAQIDTQKWEKRFTDSFTLVAHENNQIRGFCNLEDNGILDMFYVHGDFQGQGVGQLLYKSLEDEARRRGLSVLKSDVSLLARRFFLRQGFQVDKDYEKDLSGVKFNNACMSKKL